MISVLLWELLYAMMISASLVNMNIISIGFHLPSSGYVSDYDLQRLYPSFIQKSTSLSLGEIPYLRVKKFISSFSKKEISATLMSQELYSLKQSLKLEGFTLFLLNIGRSDNHEYTYCYDGVKEPDIEPEDDIIDERGNIWGTKDHVDSKQRSCKSDACQVNAWISDKRIAWIDLSAKRIPWGNKFGLALPSPPTYSISLSELFERAEQVKSIAMTNCPIECNHLVSRLDEIRSNNENDFLRVYDIVVRVSDEIENIIAKDFATDGSFGTVTTTTTTTTFQRNSYPNIDFLAQLSLVVNSFVSRVLLPFKRGEVQIGTPMFEEFSVQRVTVHLYLIKGHDDDLDLGPNQQDLILMEKELSKLSSPSFQLFSMVIHRLDLDNDPVLASAFALSLHSIMIPTIIQGRQIGKIRHYVNAEEFRQVLLSKNDRTQFSFSTTDSKHHQELPVFWFYGVDSSTEPLYVNGYHRALHLQDMVLVVESKHNSVERLDAFCGYNRVRISAEKPLRAAIIAIAQFWWSENLGHKTFDKIIDESSSISDWSWATGVGDARGLSLFEEEETLPLISNILVDAFHRSTITEVLSWIKMKMNRIKKRHSQVIMELNSLNSLVIDCAKRNKWNCAFENLLSLMKTIQSLQIDLQRQGTSNSSCRRPQTNWFNLVLLKIRQLVGIK